MKDFGDDSFSGDCFDIVGRLKGLDCSNPKDFVEILQTINRDLFLGMDEDDTSFVVSVSMKPGKERESTKARRHESKTQQPDNPQKIKPYSIIQQPFSAKETAFWQQYGITADVLKTYKVVSLKEFKSENNPVFRTSQDFKKNATDNLLITNIFLQKWVSHAQKGVNLLHVCTQKAQQNRHGKCPCHQQAHRKIQSASQFWHRSHRAGTCSFGRTRSTVYFYAVWFCQRFVCR
jgi:hypothetical protein